MRHSNQNITDAVLQRVVVIGLVALALLFFWPHRLNATEPSVVRTAAVEFVCTPERVACGWARLAERSDGVEVSAFLSGLTPGLYSIALLDVGRCGPAATRDSARLFRLRADVTRTYGIAPLADNDAVQFQADPNGRARVAFVVPGASLGAGMNSLTAGDGSALAVSYTRTTRKAACGVVKAGPTSLLTSPGDMTERF